VRIDIDSMPAGRELDALVAERIFGWKRIAEGSVSIDVQSGETVLLNDLFVSPDDYERVKVVGSALVAPMNLPDFSTDISAAWGVVEKVIRLVNRGFELSVTNHYPDIYPDIYGVDVRFDGHDMVNGNTIPLAICRAALKCVGVNQC